jgi:hypothetical protein
LKRRPEHDGAADTLVDVRFRRLSGPLTLPHALGRLPGHGTGADPFLDAAPDVGVDALPIGEGGLARRMREPAEVARLLVVIEITSW